MPNPEPLRSLRISTQAFPEGKRLAMWREIYGRYIGNVDIEPIGDAPFHADVTFHALPGVGLAIASRSAAHYRVTRELAGRGKDNVAISVLRSGVAAVSQFGGEAIAGIGSASVLTPREPSTSTMLCPGSFVTLALSPSAIAAIVPDFASAFGRPIPSDNAALRLLSRYVDVVLAGGDLANAEIAHRVSAHILDLAGLAIGARGDHAEIARLHGAKAARLATIKADIVANLGRLDLSRDAVAMRHGITPRYVGKLFEDDGTSFSEFLLRERITTAYRMLTDPHCAGHKIARIAYECGFGDLSYFNRAFRRAHGATPSDVRRLQGSAGGPELRRPRANQAPPD